MRKRLNAGPLLAMSSEKLENQSAQPSACGFFVRDVAMASASLRVMLHDTEIDCLVTKGFLKPERRRDHAAIQSAIDDFICHALGPEQDQTI